MLRVGRRAVPGGAAALGVAAAAGAAAGAAAAGGAGGWWGTPGAPRGGARGAARRAAAAGLARGEVITDNVINKNVTAMTVDLYRYLLSKTREPEVMRELRHRTNELDGSRRMQVAPEQAQLMSLLVKIGRVEKAIEIGVFTGYSALAVARALPEHGELLACDVDERTMKVAREFWEKAGVSHKIREHVAPAAETLEKLVGDENQLEQYDLAFIDADKRGYKHYYEQCLRLIKPGGMILVDNLLWYGRVVDPANSDKATVALREFNDFLAEDDRISFVIVPIGDGMSLCIKN